MPDTSKGRGRWIDRRQGNRRKSLEVKNITGQVITGFGFVLMATINKNFKESKGDQG